MTARLPFTQHGLRRAIAAARKEGLHVKGIRPDGTLLVDDGDVGENSTREVEASQTAASKWEGAKQ